jgi:glutamine cyclotransferase
MRKVHPKIFLISFLLLACFSFSAFAKVQNYKVLVVKEYPHDVTSYTQGLFFNKGVLYESTGLEGESTFRTVDLETGKAVRRFNFSNKYFVEGSVMMGDDLFILTWQNHVAFVYDAVTLKYKASYSYPREGWGLTTDGTFLIASDGSSNLYFMDGKFNVKRKISVSMNGHPINYLNELEYIDGKIFANVYLTDLILIINPDSGKVDGTVNCKGLLPSNLRTKDTDVLNGIAYDRKTNKLYLTGKNWPRLYEVRLIEK